MIKKELLKVSAVIGGIALAMLLALSAFKPKVDDFEKRTATTHTTRAAVTRSVRTVAPIPRAQVALTAATEPETTPTTAATEPEPESLGTFKLTAYCACPACCGEWADGYTYTGTVATAGRTIAVDPDVIPLGSSVLINGQEYIAEDIGGAIQGDRIDIFFDSHADALEFGIQYAEVSTVK